MNYNFVIKDMPYFEKGDCENCPIKEKYGHAGYIFTLSCFENSNGCPMELRSPIEDKLLP